MSSKNKRKSIRLNPELINVIHTFMITTKIPDLISVSGKHTIHQSIRKAIWYLFHAFFDKRGFKDRALFDGSLINLKDISRKVLEKGKDLNTLIKNYSSGQAPTHDPFPLLDDIQILFDSYDSSIESFDSSYKL